MTLTVAVLGLGEAGSAFVRDLVAAGVVVRAYDPAVPAPQGAAAAADEADAATGADLVLSVNSGKAAVAALRAALPAVTGVFADMNTVSPGVKRQLAELAGDVPFADVAITGPVPGRGLRTPMLVSGPAAERVVALLEPVGAAVTAIAGPAGLATERELLRGVFFQGLAGAVVEALAAARAAGCEDWLREDIAERLRRADEATVARLVDGTHQHATSRADVMAAAADMLAELGVEPTIASATRDQLSGLASAGGAARTA